MKKEIVIVNKNKKNKINTAVWQSSYIARLSLFYQILKKHPM